MGKWKRVKSLARRWQRNHLVTKYGSICYLCGDPFKSIKEITFDHWVPLSKNGDDDIDNYRLAHSDCNQLKKDMLPEEFLDFQLGLIRWQQ